MAGGNFDINQNKVRPGSYMNFAAKKTYAPAVSSRGVVVVPLVGYDWGPDAKFIELDNDAPDAEIAQLGRSIYDDNELIRLVRLAFENAVKVWVYIIAGGTKAKVDKDALTITAKYAGKRGNDITVTSTANVDGGFDVSLYLNGELMETFVGVTTVEELKANESLCVDFSGEGDLTAFAGAVLEGGQAAENKNSSFTAFLDAVEKVKCNTVLIPVSEESLAAAAASKVKYLRTKVGKTVQFVFADYAGDDIGIINVVNSFHLYDRDLSVADAAAWVAGVTAAATKSQSNTYKVVSNATAVVGELTNEQAEEAILAGKMFFSVSDDTGEVIIEYDINSLVYPSSTQDDSYKKNRVVRVLDSFADDLKATIRPNQFDNEPKGWEKMLQLGKLLLKQYEDDNAIKNVSADDDFMIDQSRSKGDATYFNVALQPVDSAEKLYYSISTQ